MGHGDIYDESLRKLRLLSGYANEERKSLNQFIDLGQGLIGQCAMERTTIILTKPPADYVRIRSSLGDATPRTIVALPVIRNDRLLAVVELAMFDDFDANDQALLNGILPILAMSVEILERSAKTQRLLYESQEQAQALERRRIAGKPGKQTHCAARCPQSHRGLVSARHRIGSRWHGCRRCT